MDCRRSLVMLSALFVGVAGCALTGTQQSSSIKSETPMSSVEMAADVRPERALTKRKPKASTCVAFGNNFEQEANDPGRTPADQEQIREKARKAFQQALDLDPKNIPAALGLARLHSTRGDHGRAVSTYQKALKVHPKEVTLWAELGMCHAQQKEWEPALRCLRKGLEFDPENRQLSHHLGWCLARAGHYEESLVCFRKTDGEAKAHYNLARMLHHMQQNDLSCQHLRIALEKNPQLAEAKQLLVNLESPAPDPQHVPAAYQPQ